MAKRRGKGSFSLKEDRRLIQTAAASATLEEAAATLKGEVRKEQSDQDRKQDAADPARKVSACKSAGAPAPSLLSLQLWFKFFDQGGKPLGGRRIGGGMRQSPRLLKPSF
jgi:hypothetical protein